MINGTKLLNVAGMTRGRRDGILKSEKVRHVVKIGPMHLKGVWYVACVRHMASRLFLLRQTPGFLTNEPWISPIKKRSPNCCTRCSCTILVLCSTTRRTRPGLHRSWLQLNAENRTKARCGLPRPGCPQSSTSLTTPWRYPAPNPRFPRTTWLVLLSTGPRRFPPLQLPRRA